MDDRTRPDPTAGPTSDPGGAAHEIVSGTDPGPFSSLLGFEVVGIDDAGVRLRALPGPEHCNGGGILHGGYLSSLLDSATGWAVHARMPDGVPAPHVQLTVQYVRAALPGQPLVATARCVSAGRRIASADAEVHQDGRLIARAVSSHAVLPTGS